MAQTTKAQVTRRLKEEPDPSTVRRPKGTRTTDFPPDKQIKRATKAIMDRDLGMNRQEFLDALRKVSRRKPA